MARRTIHQADCLALLGDQFDHVHEWLDQYADVFHIRKFQDYHRSFLHNSYGLEIIGARWGGKAYEAGRIHLARDYADSVPISALRRHTDKALMWFNKMFEMKPHLHPYILRGWKNGSLVAVAMGER